MNKEADKIRSRLHGKLFKYDIKKYKFKEIIESLLGCPCSLLHTHLGTYEEFIQKTDQSTLAHKVFYSNYKRLLFPTYYNLQKEFIKEIVKEPFYYQVVPTFRIGLPGNKFVGEYHKDSDYSHQPYEVNFNLGISGYEGKAALRSETFPDSKTYTTLECPYGNVLSFDHIGCMHGSDINPYNTTLVSFDFRIALLSNYYDTKEQSIHRNKNLKTGDYFSEEII